MTEKKDKMYEIWPEHGLGHMGLKQDACKHNENVRSGKTLCRNCEGTGNQMYSMYQACQECNGTGIKE